MIKVPFSTQITIQVDRRLSHYLSWRNDKKGKRPPQVEIENWPKTKTDILCQALDIWLADHPTNRPIDHPIDPADQQPIEELARLTRAGMKHLPVGQRGVRIKARRKSMPDKRSNLG